MSFINSISSRKIHRKCSENIPKVTPVYGVSKIDGFMRDHVFFSIDF